MKKTWNDASLIELDMTATATETTELGPDGQPVDPNNYPAAPDNSNSISGEPNIV